MSESSTSHGQQDERRLSEPMVRRLFAELQGLYGSRWIDMWKLGQVRDDGADLGLLNAQAVWAKALGGFAEHPKILRKALDACHAKPFPPTLPEFLELCRQYLGNDAPLALPVLPSLPEVARQKVEALAAEKASRSPKTDFRKWARDILANPSAFPAVSVRFAKEAMALPEAR